MTFPGHCSFSMKPNRPRANPCLILSRTIISSRAARGNAGGCLITRAPIHATCHGLISAACSVRRLTWRDAGGDGGGGQLPLAFGRHACHLDGVGGESSESGHLVL